jgi:hypothetical protein
MGPDQRHFYFAHRRISPGREVLKIFLGRPNPSEFTAYSIRVSGLAMELHQLNACTRGSS